MNGNSRPFWEICREKEKNQARLGSDHFITGRGLEDFFRQIIFFS